MEVLYPRCAGLDIHAGSVTACVRIATGAQVTYAHRTVPTTTRGLLQLVGKRKRLLQYIAAKDGQAYLDLIKKLGIRR